MLMFKHSFNSQEQWCYRQIKRNKKQLVVLRGRGVNTSYLTPLIFMIFFCDQYNIFVYHGYIVWYNVYAIYDIQIIIILHLRLLPKSGCAFSS